MGITPGPPKITRYGVEFTLKAALSQQPGV